MMRRLLLLLAAICAIGCSKGESSDPGPSGSKKGEQTLLMYFPWSGNLTAAFEVNIEDMKTTLQTGLPSGCRVLVFFMEDSSSGRLFELVPSGDMVQEEELALYEAPAVTTSDGIAAILDDVIRLAPANRYGLTIGSHGMAWLPVSAGRSADDGRTAPTAGEREYWEYTDEAGRPLTRWFGGTTTAWQTEIGTLREALETAGMHPEFILFDDCYMASVEVAYELRQVTDHLIGSTCEVMYYGFPYEQMGGCLLGTVDYEGVCEAFHTFYSSYVSPYGTISVTSCSELDALAAVMKEINATADASAVDPAALQVLDGYSPTRFFDLGDYVRHLTADAALLEAFEAQLERTVPSSRRRHTPSFFAASGLIHVYPIATYSGLTVSDPSTSTYTAAKTQTAWWQATH